jgi:hypothetical protein
MGGPKTIPPPIKGKPAENHYTKSESALSSPDSVSCSLLCHPYSQYCPLLSIVLAIWNTLSQMCSAIFKVIYILPITTSMLFHTCILPWISAKGTPSIPENQVTTRSSGLVKSNRGRETVNLCSRNTHNITGAAAHRKWKHSCGKWDWYVLHSCQLLWIPNDACFFIHWLTLTILSTKCYKHAVSHVAHSGGLILCNNITCAHSKTHFCRNFV